MMSWLLFGCCVLLLIALIEERATSRRKLDFLHRQLEDAEDDYEYLISGERPNADARPEWLYRD